MRELSEVTTTRAHVLRHAPARGQGLDAALVDIAQDLLFRHLHDSGLLDELVFKGGTALRKLYAGSQGRFSLDLDFSVRDIGTDTEAILDLLAEQVRGLRLGSFRYDIVTRRTKPTLTINTDLGATGQLSSKLDVSPPPWLEPVRRPWVPMPVHTTRPFVSFSASSARRKSSPSSEPRELIACASWVSTCRA